MIHKFLNRYHHGYYRLCSHKSHILKLPCWRGGAIPGLYSPVYDGFCGKHNMSCYISCDDPEYQE